MNASIQGFRLDAVHTFQVRTLRSLGYRTRVALSNASDAKPALATAYRIDASVYGPSHRRELHVEDVARLEPRKKILIDCTQFETSHEADAIIIFHLVPLRLVPLAVDGLVAVTREELYFLFTAQDHYVEYFREDGFSSGVLYQCGAFNYEKFSREGTTMVQAPKGYLSTTMDTLFSVMNTSPDPSYTKSAAFKCTLLSKHHQVTWIEDIPAFGVRSISMRDRAANLGLTLRDEPQFVCFMGLCETATLVPLTINRDLETGCIGLEHSLPPLYYATSAVGKLRARAVAGLARSRVFAQRGA
jgi:hypothetical protein